MMKIHENIFFRNVDYTEAVVSRCSIKKEFSKILEIQRKAPVPETLF